MMHSSFNLNEQNNKIESRIVVALERISEAFRVLLWTESKDNSLSPIQIQILIFLHFHSKEKCRVSYLADEFNMTKATISDSVRVLLAKQLVSKETNPEDTRSFSLTLTSEGEKIATKSALFASAIEQPLESFSTEQKSILLKGLMKIIQDLNTSGVISIQRMCFSCSNYKNQNGVHYCKLLQSTLTENELRLDCPDYEAIE